MFSSPYLVFVLIDGVASQEVGTRVGYLALPPWGFFYMVLPFTNDWEIMVWFIVLAENIISILLSFLKTIYICCLMAWGVKKCWKWFTELPLVVAAGLRLVLRSVIWKVWSCSSAKTSWKNHGNIVGKNVCEPWTTAWGEQGPVSEGRFNKLWVRKTNSEFVKILSFRLQNRCSELVQSTLSMLTPSYSDYKKPLSMELRYCDSPWQRQVDRRHPPTLLQPRDFLQKRKMAEVVKEKIVDVEEIWEWVNV